MRRAIPGTRPGPWKDNSPDNVEFELHVGGTYTVKGESFTRRLTCLDCRICFIQIELSLPIAAIECDYT